VASVSVHVTATAAEPGMATSRSRLTAAVVVRITAPPTRPTTLPCCDRCTTTVGPPLASASTADVVPAESAIAKTTAAVPRRYKLLFCMRPFLLRGVYRRRGLGRADTPSSPELPRDARGTFGVRDRHDSPPPSRGGRVLTPPAHPAPRPDRQRAQDRQDNARHDREIHPDVL